MVLSGVDDVSWGRLHHAYGTAGDVPDLLRALRSSDEETRQETHRHPECPRVSNDAGDAVSDGSTAGESGCVSPGASGRCQGHR
jgi:hypothetical protein